MSALDPADDLAVSIRVAEPELATRLAALIEQTPGLRIAKPNEPGDLVLSVLNWLFMTGLQNATVNLCPNNALGPWLGAHYKPGANRRRAAGKSNERIIARFRVEPISLASRAGSG